MRLLAIADLHLGYLANRRALDALAEHPDDWLIVAGDTGETFGRLDMALDALRGEARYAEMVDRCRARGVVTPEDPYLRWPPAGGARRRRAAALTFCYHAALAWTEAVRLARATREDSWCDDCL